MNSNIYTVVVGNIGMILETNHHSVAIRTFQDYVMLSSNNAGSAAGEDVTLFRDEEPLLEYTGDLCDL